MPEPGPELLRLVRVAYGTLLLGTLLYTCPHARRFFVSDRWRGYARSSREVDLVQNPVALVVVQAVWAGVAVLLIVGWCAPGVAFANVLLCRYFFVRMRWKGILRGMGAPGFMTWWLGLVVFGLEFTAHHAPQLQATVLFVAQVDFALLYLSSGVYKFRAGYLHGEGMELGMVNPQWGYWWRSLRRLRPSHPVFTVSNQAGWSLEVLGAILMLLPWTRFWGGLLLVISFAYVGAFIRLGLLAEMVMLTGLLYFDAASAGHAALAPVGALLPASTAPAATLPPAWGAALEAGLWTYLVLLPPAYAGLHYNFYGRRALPGIWQAALERYTNFFGMLIWRVFSADLVNFFIRVRELTDDRAVEITRFGWRTGGLRFSHVGESITLTCLFTTLKYYPGDRRRFTDRLLCYARTLPVRRGGRVRFEYVQVVKGPDRFEFRPIAEFDVDLSRGTVTERTLDASFSPRAAARHSPVHEGVRPGSYVPSGS